jgi:hypothetical protein
MTTSRPEVGGFCFRCSAPDPRHDPGRDPVSVYTPWPMLAPVAGLAYARTNPLVRAIYAPGDLRRVVEVRAERKHNPRPLAAATEADVDAFRDWLIVSHEFAHLYYLEWTPAKELARTYLALSYEPIADLMTADRLSDQDVVDAWHRLQLWTQPLAQIEESVAFVEELVATAIAFNAMAMQTGRGGLWTGFDEVLMHTQREFVAAEEEQFGGFGEALMRFEPLLRLIYGNSEFAAFVVPLLQPVKVYQTDAWRPPFALDARAALDAILALTSGCESAADAVAQLQELEQETSAEWRLALGLQMSYARERAGTDGERPPPRAELAQMLWRIGRGDFVAGTIEEVTAEAARAIAAFRARIATDSRLGLANLVLLQPRRWRRRLVMNLGWWVADEDVVPEDVQEAHLGTVVLEGLREQLLTGQGIVCPKNPEGTSRCDCPLPWRKAMLRLARLAESGAFGPGEWSSLPCRRR